MTKFLMPLLFIIAFLSAPLYVWRFELLGQPMNALMVVLGVVILFGIVHISYRRWWPEFFSGVKLINRWLLGSLGLLALASVIALFVGGVDSPKLAQWLVLYVQPILVFFLLQFYFKKYPTLRHTLSLAIYILLGAAGVVALLQFFALWSLPMDWWGNSNEPKRAISFFAHPNAFSLFVTPLLAWLLPDAVRRLGLAFKKFAGADTLLVLLWLVGAAGMFLSLSRGAWLGFFAACVLFALLSANKKIILGLVVIGVVVAGLVAVTPNLRYRVLLPFYGEKSAVARLSLWNTAGRMIADSPVLGKGIHGFNYNWDKYNQDRNLEHYNFPHNIFLNFWVDSGLLGLIAMVSILVFGLWQGITRRRNQYHLALALFMAALVVHGLIDIPYLKNDLALVFWMIMAISL